VVVVSALALAAGLLTLALLAKPAQAQAETVTDTHRSLFGGGVSGCTEESVIVEGTLYTVAHTTIDANGGFHTKLQFNIKGQGEGLSSGDKYVYNDIINLHENSPSGAAINTTITDPFKVIRSGSDTPTDDLHAKVLFHVTVNAQGEVTTQFLYAEFVCT